MNNKIDNLLEEIGINEAQIFRSSSSGDDGICYDIEGINYNVTIYINDDDSCNLETVNKKNIKKI